MKRILSGIAPSGDGSLHIGNYLGMVRQSIELAKTFECYLFVADLHALTTIQSGKQLASNIETLILNELALLQGFLTPEEFNKIIFFRQSDVAEHTELQSILNNVTPLGLIKRAHAYKDKLEKEINEDDINMGLFNYPVLMAADILIYKPDLVPVGKDQKQHIEIARDIAQRFNKIYPTSSRDAGLRGTSKTGVFKLPEGYIPENVATIPGTDGKRKMSKSLGNIISIFEDEKIIEKQVMGTYTDPTRIHATDPGHVAGNMVFTYLDFLGEKQQVTNLKELYTEGKIADVEVKKYLYESLMKFFAPARLKYAELKNDPQKVKDILASGAEKARAVAGETLKEVREVIGLVNKYSFGFTRGPLAVYPELVEGQEDLLISINDFSKVEIRVGKVEKAENVEKSEKLIRLTVSFGEHGTRVIFTGVRGFDYAPEDFSSKQFFFVVNLEPKKMLGEESQGMILAVDEKNKPIFVSAEGLPLGAKIH